MPRSLTQRCVAWTGPLALALALLGGCTSAADAPAPPASSLQAPALSDSVLSPPDTTAARFRAALQAAHTHRAAAPSIGALAQAVGLHFRGRPYLTGTLDAPSSETLVVRFDGFDCVTFLETALALARSAEARDSSYAGFARRLAQHRYRDGARVGYCGRLHYFTEWLTNNAERGFLQRLGGALKGRPLRDTLNFMTAHRSAYPRMAANDSLFGCVRAAERRLRTTQRHAPVRYVPQDSIRAVYDQLRGGDVVALVSPVDGLNVSHTGLVYAGEDGGRGLLHASLDGGVVVSPDLQRYVQKIDGQIGMVVARPRSAP